MLITESHDPAIVREMESESWSKALGRRRVGGGVHSDSRAPNWADQERALEEHGMVRGSQSG